MKKLILICMLISPLCRAQDSTNTGTRLANPINHLRENVWRVLFLSPGVANEVRLGVRTTLSSGLRLDGAIVGGGNNDGRLYTSYYFSPVLSSGIRYYYNLERRLRKEKSIRYNSANYLTIRANYFLPPFIEHIDARAAIITPEQGISVQAMWGFQRTYRRNFYLNLALGVGASQRYVGLASEFALGYTFPGKPQRLR